MQTKTSTKTREGAAGDWRARLLASASVLAVLRVYLFAVCGGDAATFRRRLAFDAHVLQRVLIGDEGTPPMSRDEIAAFRATVSEPRLMVRQLREPPAVRGNAVNATAGSRALLRLLCADEASMTRDIAARELLNAFMAAAVNLSQPAAVGAAAAPVRHSNDCSDEQLADLLCSLLQ